MIAEEKKLHTQIMACKDNNELIELLKRYNEIITNFCQSNEDLISDGNLKILTIFYCSVRLSTLKIITTIPITASTN